MTTGAAIRVKTKTRIAPVEASPIFMDLDQSKQKARDRIRDAASQGTEFVAFPEVWLPGYPAWLDCFRNVGHPHRVMEIVYSRLAFTQYMES